jgi:hypothetical protein
MSVLFVSMIGWLAVLDGVGVVAELMLPITFSSSLLPLLLLPPAPPGLVRL